MKLKGYAGVHLMEKCGECYKCCVCGVAYEDLTSWSSRRRAEAEKRCMQWQSEYNKQKERNLEKGKVTEVDEGQRDLFTK